jgi:plastocyanin
MLARLRSAPLVTFALTAIPLPLHALGHHKHHRTKPATARFAVGKPGTPHPRATPRLRHDHPQVVHKRHRRKHHRHHHRAKAPRTAHAAADPSDTIVGFKFSPGTLTIHVGDTVTWTNQDTAPHTATAQNGSFNTGTLKKGQSGSHTFTQAGTFAYICAIHPFMHGTIVVVANTTTSSGASGGNSNNTTANTSSSTNTSSSSSNNTTSGTDSSTTNNGDTLPFTGMDLPATVLSGLALLGLGLTVRRRLRGL